MRLIVQISTIDDDAGEDCLQPRELIRSFTIERNGDAVLGMLPSAVQSACERMFSVANIRSFAIEDEDI